MEDRKEHFNVSPTTLADWVKENEEDSNSIWNWDWNAMLDRKNKHDLEEYLSSFCLSVLDLNEQEQVFIVRTVFISIITHLLRIQRHKRTLEPKTLSEAYKMIYHIESWENISRFILEIPQFLYVIIDRIMADFSLHNATPLLDKALQLINENISSTKLSVNWLAEQLNVSTTHLSNLFRLNLGVNPSNYIAKRKITEITFELIHTSEPLAKIRKKYGFISHSHFIQFFKKHKGITPLKYRQHVHSITGDRE